MKSLLKITILIFLFGTAQEATAKKTSDNQLSKKEAKKGWVLLFDGKTTDGWRGFGGAVVPAVWSVQNGTLTCRGIKMDNPKPDEKGFIISDRQYSNFHLKVDWKISPAGNSGIFYLAQEEGYNSIVQNAPEMQILDNQLAHDATKGKNGNRQAGSLYDLIPANPQNAKPVDEWNTSEIIVKDRKVTHIQNGEKVVEYEIGTAEFNALVAESKFPKMNPNWQNIAEKGHIGLQDHNNDVWFKNIKIKEL
jgi:hypothetical protein